MASLSDLPENLGTEKQRAAYAAYVEHGSYRKAAEALGIDHAAVIRHVKTLQEKALRAGFAPEGFRVSKVTTQTGADGIEKTHVQVRAAADEQVVHVPDPKKITGTSTLFAGDGSVINQWVLERASEKEREALWKVYAEELGRKVERVEPRYAPHRYTDNDMLAVYPVGDHHIGMLAWKHETLGASYDMEISEELLAKAAARLMATQAPAASCLLPFLGDFLHYDGFAQVTPTNRNLLDADGRYPKMVRVAIRAVRHMIEAALRHHKEVNVIFEIGNHDMATAVFMMELLANVYEREPRVKVDTSPARFHYFRFGKTLIGVHHGDGVKMDQLGGIMANDRPVDWGETEYRYWYTGHVHNRSVFDGRGWSAESFRILAPVDAWAASKGYRGQRDMRSILIDRDHGEVARAIVTPAMLRR
ncbi:MAG: hypothetical protein AB7U76_24270 [Pirellulales bacterium]